MTLKEITQAVKENITTMTGGSYSFFAGTMPLSTKKGLSLAIKNADIGNSISNCIIFKVTLRSVDRDLLIDHVTALRKVFNRTIPAGIITEVPEQDFLVEGIKGTFRWIWESSFELKAVCISKNQESQKELKK